MYRWTEYGDRYMDIVWPIMVKRGHNLFYGPTSEIYFIYFLFGLVTCHQPDYDYGFYVQFCYIIFTFNISNIFLPSSCAERIGGCWGLAVCCHCCTERLPFCQAKPLHHKEVKMISGARVLHPSLVHPHREQTLIPDTVSKSPDHTSRRAWSR